MLLCPPIYWNRESQNSQDTACSIYVLWKTWLKRKIRKQPCSTFTVSYRVKCEEEDEDESEKRNRRVEWFFIFPSTDAILVVTGERTLRNPHNPAPPLCTHTLIHPPNLHSFFLLWCLSPLRSPSLCPPIWRSVWSVPREALTQRRYLQDPHWAHF